MFLCLTNNPAGDLDCEHQVESLPSERLLPETDDPTSLLFDHWITAAEVGQRYGIAPADVARVSDWLDPQGFKVNSVYPSQMVIDFPGLAGSSAMRPIRLRPGPSRKPASYIAGSQGGSTCPPREVFRLHRGSLRRSQPLPYSLQFQYERSSGRRFRPDYRRPRA